MMNSQFILCTIICCIMLDYIWKANIVKYKYAFNVGCGSNPITQCFCLHLSKLKLELCYKAFNVIEKARCALPVGSIWKHHCHTDFYTVE